MQFLGGLAHTLRNGVPEEQQAALRQCIGRIHINNPASNISTNIRSVPTASLGSTYQVLAVRASVRRRNQKILAGLLHEGMLADTM